MKTMTCEQLGGACDMRFTASSFTEIAEMSKQHGAKMFEKRDPNHLAAMEKMKDLMQNPQKMEEWFKQKQQEFNSLPDGN